MFKLLFARRNPSPPRLPQGAGVQGGLGGALQLPLWITPRQAGAPPGTVVG